MCQTAPLLTIPQELRDAISEAAFPPSNPKLSTLGTICWAFGVHYYGSMVVGKVKPRVPSILRISGGTKSVRKAASSTMLNSTRSLLHRDINDPFEGGIKMMTTVFEDVQYWSTYSFMKVMQVDYLNGFLDYRRQHWTDPEADEDSHANDKIQVKFEIDPQLAIFQDEHGKRNKSSFMAFLERLLWFGQSKNSQDVLRSAELWRMTISFVKVFEGKENQLISAEGKPSHGWRAEVKR